MKKITPNHPISVSLVIPVFNNAKTINKQLKKCINLINNVCQKYEIVISNDASTDNTKELLERFTKNKNIKIFHQKKNLGIAQNILFLYKKAKHSYILLFSIDGDWDPQDIKRLINYAQKNSADIVIGKREIKDYTFFRKSVSAVYNTLPHLLFNVKTYDAGSIKIFKNEILQNISLHSKSVSFEPEMLIRAAKKGYTIFAIPVKHKKHIENKKSSVNIPLIRDSLFDLLKLRMQKI